MEYYLATKRNEGVSLVAEGWRICLPMQETWVWSLICEDSTCCGATKPVHHNHWACAPRAWSRDYWAHVLQPVLRNKRSHWNEKPSHHVSRKAQAATKAQHSQKRVKKKKRKKPSTSTYYNINLENIMLSERNQYKEPYTGWFHLAEMSGKGKSIMTVH